MNLRIHFCAALATLISFLEPDISFAASNDASAGDYVILLHGAGRTHVSLNLMAAYLRGHGYRVINARFQSAGLSIEQIADSYFPELIGSLNPHAKVHFVAHSMGGIILRQYLSTHTLTNLGRVVMVAPPNHGSEIVDRVKTVPVLKAALGQRLLELGTGPRDLPRRLGPANFDCGIIAGDFSANPLTSWFLHSANDGRVTVEGARLDGMRDFLVVHNSHTWMIWRQSIMRQVLTFLEQGAFDHVEFKREISDK